VLEGTGSADPVIVYCCCKKVKVARTRLQSVRFRSWSRFLAVSLQVMWVINPAVGCHYFPPGLQLPSQHLRGLRPVLLLGEQRHNRCEQFTYDCCPTASWLRFEPGLSASESSTLATRLPSHPLLLYHAMCLAAWIKQTKIGCRGNVHWRIEKKHDFRLIIYSPFYQPWKNWQRSVR